MAMERNESAMRKLVRFLALAVLALVFVFPTVALADQTVTFSTIASGPRSGVRTQTQVVIRTPTEWNVLWRKHSAGLPTTSGVPKVDFSRDMVIAVFAGDAPAATRVSIVRILQQQSQLIVLVRIGEMQPGPTQIDSAEGSPFQVVRLARSTLPVIFLPAKAPRVY